jgi:hypothetical protein
MKKYVPHWSDFDECHCPVRVRSLITNEVLEGVAGFSKSRKTVYVWQDDSSCDKFMLTKDGTWKIPCFDGHERFEITED